MDLRQCKLKQQKQQSYAAGNRVSKHEVFQCKHSSRIYVNDNAVYQAEEFRESSPDDSPQRMDKLGVCTSRLEAERIRVLESASDLRARELDDGKYGDRAEWIDASLSGRWRKRIVCIMWRRKQALYYMVVTAVRCSHPLWTSGTRKRFGFLVH